MIVYTKNKIKNPFKLNLFSKIISYCNWFIATLLYQNLMYVNLPWYKQKIIRFPNLLHLFYGDAVFAEDLVNYIVDFLLFSIILSLNFLYENLSIRLLLLDNLGLFSRIFVFRGDFALLFQHFECRQFLFELIIGFFECAISLNLKSIIKQIMVCEMYTRSVLLDAFDYVAF